MAIPRTTAAKGRRARSRPTPQEPVYPQAAQWALRALIEGKAYRSMAAHPLGPDASTLELLGMEELVNETIKPRELLQKLLEVRGISPPEKARHPIILDDNLSALEQLLGLDPVDCEILALMVYRDLIPGMRDVCNLEERASGICGFSALAACMLDRPESQVREAFSVNSRLLGSGLMVPPTSYRDGPIELSTGLADLLLHHSDAAHAIQRQFSDHGRAARHDLDEFQHLADLRGTLVSFLQGALGEKLLGVNILIHGQPGTGKTQLARALACFLRVSLHEIRSSDTRGLPIPASERFSSYRYCQSLLAGDDSALLLFDECDDVLSGSESVGQKAWINGILETNPRPTLWLCNDPGWFDPAFLRRFDLIVEMPALSAKQRASMAQQAFANLPVTNTWLQQLAEQSDLQAAHLATAARVVRAMNCSDISTAEAAAEHVLAGLSSSLGLALSPRCAENSATELPFDPSLANADQDLGRLLRAIAKSRTGRLCLFGPPGTGKSEFARHIAEHLKTPLIVRHASDLISAYVGATEQNIAAAFAEADQRRGVLLIDEADSLLYSRVYSRHQWEVSQVNELLQQMERYRGVLVMTSNSAKLIDQAALRRFDLKIRFDYLTTEQSCRFFQHVIGKSSIRIEGDFLRRSMRAMQLTPGDFSTVIRRFKVLGEPVNEVGLLQGLRQEFAVRVELGGQ